MPDKQHILNSITAIAKGLGRAPTRSEFVSLAGISEYFVTHSFPSWNDAVRSAGLHAKAVRTGFPDCEAMRQVTPERWQRVNIEFEFESKNFRDHGHPASGCDIIVCWLHNWDDCPQGIEILELFSIIRSLVDAQN